jgi:threonine/homoserine/homoserine lactone efflux protein
MKSTYQSQEIAINGFSWHRLNPFSVIFWRRFLAQVFCDSSFHTAALSTAANLRYNDLHEQIANNNGQSKKKIR